MKRKTRKARIADLLLALIAREHGLSDDGIVWLGNELHKLCIWQRTETLRGTIDQTSEVLKLRERVAHLERAYALACEDVSHGDCPLERRDWCQELVCEGDSARCWSEYFMEEAK